MKEDVRLCQRSTHLLSFFSCLKQRSKAIFFSVHTPQNFAIGFSWWHWFSASMTCTRDCRTGERLGVGRAGRPSTTVRPGAPPQSPNFYKTAHASCTRARSATGRPPRHMTGACSCRAGGASPEAPDCTAAVSSQSQLLTAYWTRTKNGMHTMPQLGCPRL